jgi:hypothetical protein
LSSRCAIGKLCRLDFGSYPKMSLRSARNENDRLRGELEQGHDPRVVRLIEMKAISAGEADTLAARFRDWYDKYLVNTKPAYRQIWRSFEILMFCPNSAPCITGWSYWSAWRSKCRQ